MFDWIFLPEAWVALATLLALEIVLGIMVHVGRVEESLGAGRES